MINLNLILSEAVIELADEIVHLLDPVIASELQWGVRHHEPT